MALFNISVHVRLQPGILDPKGKAARSALLQLGFSGVDSVRINKTVELTIEAASKEEALDIANAAAARLLANPVTESYTVHLV